MNWNKVQEILEYSDWDLGITEQNLKDLKFNYMDSDDTFKYYQLQICKTLFDGIELLARPLPKDRFKITILGSSKSFTKISFLFSWINTNK